MCLGVMVDHFLVILIFEAVNHHTTLKGCISDNNPAGLFLLKPHPIFVCDESCLVVVGGFQHSPPLVRRSINLNHPYRVLTGLGMFGKFGIAYVGFTSGCGVHGAFSSSILIIAPLTKANRSVRSRFVFKS